MSYRVTKQYQKGAETLDTVYKSYDQACQYAEQEAKKQAVLNIHVTLRVYEFDEEKYSVKSSEIIQSGVLEEAADSGRQQSGLGFRPTPLEMSPRPKGSMPNHYLKNDPDEEKQQ